MCDAGISATLIATAITTAVSMYAQHESQQTQERAARNAAQYNADVAANEAVVQQELARNEMAKGIADRERQQRDAARKMGSMRAGFGASGFTMDSGSALSMLSESAEEHQYDSQVIMSNATQNAWQHQVAANNALNNQGFAEYQKANAGSGRTASMLNMGATVLGGIGQSIGQYNSWNQTNRPGSLSSVGSYSPQMEHEYDMADNLYGVKTGNRYKFGKR